METKNIVESSKLPIEMIQHIQTFLNVKEAAQSTILSKSWYKAWLTRPDLHFNYNEYRIKYDNHTVRSPSESVFVKLVNETLVRYDESNLKIKKFKLTNTCNSPLNYYVATEWTRKAIKLGATDIELINDFYDFNFVLPREVLESESLVKLSLTGGRVDLQEVESNNIWDLISMSPLIEELVLSHCKDNSKMLVLKGLGVNNFHKLKVLSLMEVEVGECLFRDFTSKFSCLKKLILQYCVGYKELQICSNSLECIVMLEVDERRMLKAEFDVPQIRKFELSSTCVPSLSFRTTSRKWESDISVVCEKVDSSWFVEFRKFLLELSSSKILLDIIFVENAYECANIMGLPKPPIVDKLSLCLAVPPSSVLEELFWSCRPNLILFPFYFDNDDVVKLICSTLIKEECAMHDLEEVKIEISGHTEWTWSKVKDASAFEYSGLIESETNVNLQLKWG